ncbi:DUF6046 domain-containing protein [Arachidicoccus soli]|uniref:DUF6046 domain-containing protein n=1 Tax=Arachidicoccus soli TaxID=2341117 RepID=A0A386HRV0_9BACT|nr:DUF6046 domain-containing protein [Arachidicoccus soli]AYD48200.1 hypothetical protein D6B99_11690 [Arachidicoccus soli]
MARTNSIFDLQTLYQKTFGSKPYVIENTTPSQNEGQPYQLGTPKTQTTSIYGSTLQTQYMGVEIWLPVTFRDLPQSFFKDLGNCEIVDVAARKLNLYYSVVRVTGRKQIIKTPVNARQGTVKEGYNIDDYNITIRGFLIDKKNYGFPELQIIALRRLFELNQAVALDNAMTNLFTDTVDNMAIESLDFPEVEGGKKHIRPFVMQMVSDNISSLNWVQPNTLSNNNTITPLSLN